MGVVPPGWRIRSWETGEQLCAMLLGFTQSWASGFANRSAESVAWRWGKVSACWSKGWVLSTVQSGWRWLSLLCSSWMILRGVSARPVRLLSCELQKYSPSMSTGSKLRAHMVVGCWADCCVLTRVGSCFKVSLRSCFQVCCLQSWYLGLGHPSKLSCSDCVCKIIDWSPGLQLPGWRAWLVQWHSLAGPLRLYSPFISEHYFKL